VQLLWTLAVVADGTGAGDYPLGAVVSSVDVGEREKMRFGLDSEADMCLYKRGSLKAAIVYGCARSVSVTCTSDIIDVRGESTDISTKGLETDHKFQVEVKLTSALMEFWEHVFSKTG
jgi:hypothetical protein